MLIHLAEKPVQYIMFYTSLLQQNTQPIKNFPIIKLLKVESKTVDRSDQSALQVKQVKFNLVPFQRKNIKLALKLK